MYILLSAVITVVAFFVVQNRLFRRPEFSSMSDWLPDVSTLAPGADSSGGILFRRING
jgi:hypothetical protein